ncbi:CPBP family intramembrane metalloprotease [Polaribacter aestuariivivens]|uniref:CPBP family intramembrane metalloprotease n=1 Tax=Polaribacter aestuariivivens TaxID=2304626 RepID=A0A5S3NB83_9FLAO|nr:CPBP family intramembrane glutamic endopeptidase [Polaribacter aestuariivivens]TMM32387.1 CPBP family intramembrane metalloprotease [Polaribacter aestuariivivens]
MKTVNYKLIELFFLFVLIPISFTINYLPILKLSIGVLGFVYVLYVLFKVEKIQFKIRKDIHWKDFWRTTFLKFLVIAIVTTLFVWFTDNDSFFNVVLHKPIKWLLILFFYAAFSVYPQELLYRTFYFKRYKNLFKNERLFIFINAILFSLAHLFFKNSIVIAITFIGGLLFAITYNKTKSTFLVSIEHALYGCWLFTVGMGSMLGFPT